jgi:hypothetical protein
MSIIIPTIGRKLYYHPHGNAAIVRYDDTQPVDATVVYVWPLATADQQHYLLNLLVVDHTGRAHVATSVPLIQDGDTAPEGSAYAEWMPYQVGQAKAQSALPGYGPRSNANANNLAQSSEPVLVVKQFQPEGNVVSDGAGSAASSENQQPTPASSSSDSTSSSEQPSTSHTGGDGDNAPVQFGFDGALAMLKNGMAVTRSGWHGAYVYLVPAASYPAQTAIAKKAFGENGMVPYMAYLAIKRADGQVCVFSPGVDSILAEDWQAAV